MIGKGNMFCEEYYLNYLAFKSLANKTIKMKNSFKWALPFSEEEIKEIWDTGILTVDTNVLLDLYRYHQDTRQALLDALEGFSKRTWLPYQVAEEFFRNRRKVILSAQNEFENAEKEISEIEGTISESLKKLKHNRIIPDKIEKELGKAITSALDKTNREIKKTRDNFPDYSKNDPILEKICELFDSRIGSQFDLEKLPDILKEAKRRKENKIPPGFMDSKKEGNRPYGDFIMWRQILDHIKTAKKPLIFVTSEQKEDWWEKSSGKTIGPLYELLKEFHEETQTRFLLYRTDRFLDFSNKNLGKEANSDAVEEILNFVRQRGVPIARVIAQEEYMSSSEKASGLLKVRLLESVYKFNCTGHFDPELNFPPRLQVNLINHPGDIPIHHIGAGTGTTFDFHIYIKSNAYGTPLPIGDYIFEYNATTESLNRES
jgi:hypothetical protein